MKFYLFIIIVFFYISNSWAIDTKATQAVVVDYNTKEVLFEVNADTLNYLSVPGLYKAVNNGNGNGHCDACFTGNYPTNVKDS